MLKKQQLQKKYQHISQKYQNKIAFRYLSIAIIFLMVIQLLISGIENKFVYQHEIERVVQVVETDADFFSIIARDAFLRYDRITLEKLANSINEKRDVIYSSFLDRNGQIIAYEIKPKYLAERQLSLQNNSATTPQDLIERIKRDRKVTEISRVVKNGDRIIGEIKLAYSVGQIQQEIKILSLLDLGYATLISILFATLTLIIFNQQILHPLKKIKQLAKEFATGNLEPRVNLQRKDEIGELGDALNSMASQFQYTLSNLEKVMDEALIAEKAKTKFLGKMSHELRTPLNGIIGFTQLMQQEQTNTTEGLESLNIIESNALHLLDLINDVLELTKIEAGKSSLNISKFNFYHFLESLKQMFSFKAQEKNIELIFEIEETVPHHIENDRDKIRQIIANILENSIKFTDRGRVTMTVKKKQNESHQNGHNLYFKIADTGKGIASEEIDNVFVAFAQTESRGKAAEGMGLGLPMSKQLLQLMGGDISIKSEVERGTVIRFSIPLTEVDVTDLNFPPSPSTNWEIESLDADSIESKFFYDRTSSYDLSKKKLAIMPSEWLLELQESTIKVDNDLIFSILEKIPNQDQDLKQALIDLVENFKYDSILELTDDALSKK
jgi:signal transduction histidine kinase